jgi:hypothetical protein
MCLLLPYLFINGQGHYSLVPKNQYAVVDEAGGIAVASRYETLGSYIKQQLLNKDRHFARDASFLFWCFDMKEKHNIRSANRHTVRTSGRQLTQHDIIDSNRNYIKDRLYHILFDHLVHISVDIIWI